MHFEIFVNILKEIESRRNVCSSAILHLSHAFLQFAISFLRKLRLKIYQLQNLLEFSQLQKRIINGRLILQCYCKN